MEVSAGGALTLFGAADGNTYAQVGHGGSGYLGTIADSTITVDAVDDGIRGKDYLVVKGGSLTVKAGGDGLKADNAEDTALGFVTILDGTLAITAAGGMRLAPGTVEPWRAAVMLITTCMVVAGANALNCYLERDSDRLMQRTARRPLSDWVARGIARADGSAIVASDARSALLLPAGRDGPAFLVFRNYDAIY